VLSAFEIKERLWRNSRMPRDRSIELLLDRRQISDVQLVISLGGGLKADDLGPLAGNPVVVNYAPQVELVRRTALTISRGGLKTVLEALSYGVPQVVIPVTNDQPGLGLASNGRVPVKRFPCTD
jgi:UDP:flavonoid glycosyltransferase YjiC (YdhE family)